MIELVFRSGVRTSRPFESLPAAIEWITLALEDNHPYGPTGFRNDGTEHDLAWCEWRLDPIIAEWWPMTVLYLSSHEQIETIDREIAEANGIPWSELDDTFQYAGGQLGDVLTLITAPIGGRMNCSLMLNQYRVIAGMEDAARRLGLPNAKDRRHFGRVTLRPLEDAVETMRLCALDAINSHISGTWINAERRSAAHGDVTVILDDGTRPRGRTSPAGSPRLGIFSKGSL